MPSRVNLYEENFDQLIEDRGNWADWSRAMVCFCVSRDSGQPDFTCPVCGGKGYRYLEPKRIKVAVTSLSGEFNMETLQIREPGIAYVTPKSDVIMGYQDRLQFTDFSCVFSEVIQWDEEDGYGISGRTYRNIEQPITLRDGEYEYELGKDYEVTEDGFHIRWLNKDYLPKLYNRNMSFLYLTTPSYVVSDILHELRGTLSDRNSPGVTFRELPKQYKMQREDFVYNVADPEPLDKPPIEEDNPTLEDDPSVPEVEITESGDGGITV